MATQIGEGKSLTELVISWEALPENFQLEDEPVENTSQPILAGALRESLEIAGFIQRQMLIASNFALCATLNGQFIAKAPDWVYVPNVNQNSGQNFGECKSYTPNLEGDIPAIVMEFISDSDGGEYSVKPTYPPGKWFFYEQILKVTIYVIFDSKVGLLEFYQLKNGRYELQQPNSDRLHWIDSMSLFLGTWQGTKEARTGYWLRWWDELGNLLPWAVERVEQERQRAEQEHQRAEQERQQKEKLIAYLQSQGIDPNTLLSE
jgi:hypothetical protein